MKKSIYLFVSITLLLASCQSAFYKRQYREGIYLHNKGSQPNYHTNTTVPKLQRNLVEQAQVLLTLKKELVQELKTSVKDTNLNKKKVQYPSNAEPEYYPESKQKTNQSAPPQGNPYERSPNSDFYNNRDDARLALLMACGGCFMPVASVFSVIMARRVLRDINTYPELEPNRATAQAALVISYITLGIYALILLFYLVIILAYLAII